MTREELELLCHPLTPEEALRELGGLYQERVNLNGGAGDEPLDALNAGYNILSRLIESFEEAPSVRAGRIMF